MAPKNRQEPYGEPAGPVTIRTVPQQRDLNINGNIFGGWVLSQMDIAGALIAGEHAAGRVATVAVEAMKFHQPVNLGDTVSVYAELEKVGRTSLTVAINVFAERPGKSDRRRVTEGRFVFVAIDENGQPRPVLQTHPA